MTFQEIRLLEGGRALDHKTVPVIGDIGKIEPSSALELAADEARIQPVGDADPNPPLASPICGDFPHGLVLETVGD